MNMDINLIINTIFYLNLFSIIAFSIIFTSHVQPIEYLKLKLGLNSNSKLYSKIWLINLFIQGLKKLLNCGGCLSFWISLIVFKDIRISFIVYCMTYYISNKINQVNL